MKTKNNVTTFYLSPAAFDCWMHQNHAIYSGEYVSGCLLDNFVVCTKRGYAAIYEHYLNTNSSDYLVEFQPGAAQDVFAAWYKFEESAAQE